ncbi:MAG: sporulation protein YqfC [Firmicutes bacterium]|nr:hypothetical protein [Dethiobacter sp.]MBS3888410.1 sporulation protein YqfC [Bacillota bacterium]MBS4055456.1 hypothetical protein [Thermaerobacter sp.]
MRGWRGFFNSMLDMPEEMVFNLPRLTMVGNRHLIVENYLCILAFELVGLRIAVKGGSLTIQGDDLTLLSIGREEVVVAGKITILRYETDNHEK